MFVSNDILPSAPPPSARGSCGALSFIPANFDRFAKGRVSVMAWVLWHC